MDQLDQMGIIKKKFNLGFLLGLTPLIWTRSCWFWSFYGGSLHDAGCVMLSLPIGVASICLEEFAPRNWITDVLEVNISNLAAVPSIVFGILGLAVLLILCICRSRHHLLVGWC